MLKNERYDKILEILEEKKYISSRELSKKLFVSLPTIRRDLDYLQRTKQILRSHGGARKIDSQHLVMPIDFRKSVNIPEKKRICQAAVKLISDNSIIFLDGSTTVQQMAGLIGEKNNVTVITNSVPLTMLLMSKGIKTYCTGGELQESSMAYAGTFAEEFVHKFNIDMMFFSSQGISRKGDITDGALAETQLRRTVIKQSEKTVFLCDSTKLLTPAPYNLVSVKDVDFVITDSFEINDLIPCGDTEVIIV